MATASRSPYASHGYVDVDVEKAQGLSAFADAIIRKAFVKKVFGLLTIQLALTTVIAGTFVASATAKTFLLTNSWIVGASMIATLAILFSMVFNEKLRHSHPTNLIMLFAFTAFEGVIVGAASCMYRTDLVVTAFGITAAMTTGLCMYALSTKEDFTMMGGMLYSCLLALLAATFVGFFFRTPLFNIAVSLGGAVLFSAFIVYDVQMMMGGTHKYSISPDEYVFASISIYIDVINLFLHILRILNEMRGDN